MLFSAQDLIIWGKSLKVLVSILGDWLYNLVECVSGSSLFICSQFASFFLMVLNMIVSLLLASLYHFCFFHFVFSPYYAVRAKLTQVLWSVLFINHSIEQALLVGTTRAHKMFFTVYRSLWAVLMEIGEGLFSMLCLFCSYAVNLCRFCMAY